MPTTHHNIETDIYLCRDLVGVCVYLVMVVW